MRNISTLVFSCLLFLFAFKAGAQKGTLQGKITTSDGKPAAFVNVSLKELKKGITTAEDGLYILTEKEGTYTLVVSFVGLQTREKQIAIRRQQTTEANFELTENANQLEIVIVTARKSLNETPAIAGKIAIDPMDLPQSIAVIGQSVIRDQQALRLSDVVRNVNGVYLTTTRGSTQESFAARGYAFSSSNMFKNGSRVNSGVMPEVSSLEKVEVLKGSASILYGNVAPGGIMNMVTKQPKFNFGGEVSMRVGSYDLYKPTFDIYGPISTGTAYRLNGTFESGNSFRDVVHYKRYYINPSFLFKTGKRAELLVEGDYLKHNFTPDFRTGTIGNTKIPPVARSAFFGASWQYAKTQQTTASASFRQQFNGSWKLVANVSYQNYKRDYYSTERIQADSTGKWVRPLGRTNTDEKYYTAEVDVTGKFKTGSIEHTVLTGVDADRYYITNFAYNQPANYDSINILDLSEYITRTDIPAAERIRVVHTPTNRVGAYVQDLISLTAKLKLLAGVRFSYQKALPPDTTNLLTHINYKGISKPDQAFSPRISLVYRPVNSVSVFASYANSFSVNTGTDIYGNGLPPSIIDQFEAGVKNEFFKGLLSANLTFYRIINHNLAQISRFTSSGEINNNTSIKELTGQTTSDGVELDLFAHPVAGLEIIAGYSYNYMRYTKTLNAKGNYVEGERLVNNPSNTANASIYYVFRKECLKGLKLGVSAFYTGNRFGGYNNTIGQTQHFSRLIPVSGFTTIDISAGYIFRNISLIAKISNITNTLSYYVHENYSINPIAPRQLAATVSYRF